MAKEIIKSRQAAEEPQPQELNIQPYYEGPFSVVYSNFASISHTKDDLCIDFCLLAPPHRVDIGEKTAHVPVVARVLIPPAMADGLIHAIKIHKDKLSKDGNRIVLSIKKPRQEAKK